MSTARLISISALPCQHRNARGDEDREDGDETAVHIKACAALVVFAAQRVGKQVVASDDE
jgi:hypothetical protein